jgi:hypothetical protein
MPDHLKYKMYDHEVTPPVTTWESIAARLNDDDQYAVLAGKLYNYEETPPINEWKAIEARLADDGNFAGLAQKLNEYEADPPAPRWTQIASTLDQLNEETIAAPVIPITRRLFKYAVAALLAGLLIGGWFMYNNYSPHNAVADVKPHAPATLPAIPQQANPVLPAEKQSADPGNLSAFAGDLFPKKQSPIVTTSNAQERPLSAAVIAAPNNQIAGTININFPPLLDKSGALIQDIDHLTTNSNYLVVAGPNGQLTRISAKFANMIRYLNGTDDDTVEYLDKVIKESSIWKKRFQEWRSKISQSSYIPSSTNFLDIVELKELIEEKP